MDGGGAVAGTSLGESGNGRQTAGRADWDGRSVARPDRQPCPPAGRADSLVGRADGRAGGRPCGRRGGLIDGRPGARTGGQAGGHTHS